MEKKRIKTLLECLAKNGVCQTGERYLNRNQKNIATLAKVWRGWPEYLYEHSAFALDMLRKYLDSEDKVFLSKDFLFLDYTGTIKLGGISPIYLIGESEVTLTMDDFATAKIYLFNSAKVAIICNRNAYLNIETFDNSELKIINGEKGKCVVYQYDNSIIEGVAKIEYKEYIRGKVFNGNESETSKTY